jgi:hypothetical protein
LEASLKKAFLGWQGITLSHPAAWELNRVKGGKKASYLAFDDGERPRLEIDWKPVSSKTPVEALVDKQVKTLEKTAKRRRTEFHVERRAGLGRVHGFEYEAYNWWADVGACEIIARCEGCGRVVLVRVIGAKDKPPKEEARAIFPSLACECSKDSARWGIFGLEVKVPSRFGLDQSALKAGMVELVFTDRKVELRVMRVSLGRLILETKKMVAWYEEAAPFLMKPFDMTWTAEPFRGHLGHLGTGVDRRNRKLLRFFKSKRAFCSHLFFCEPTDKIYVVSADGTDDVADIVRAVREDLVCHR